MNVVVTYESRTGNTRRAAELIAGAARSAGAESVTVFPVARAGEFFHELAEADVVYVGTWTDGLVFFGHRPGGTSKLKSLPKLWNKRVGAFVTYAVNPGDVTDKLAGLLERHGATVTSTVALHRRRIDEGVSEFIADSLSRV